jgi:predicted phage-related endonuclease
MAGEGATMILQTDPGWLPERRGRLTASRMNDALAFLKNGKESEARRKYKVELVAERMVDVAVDRYVSPAMQRGLDLEPDARAAYEAHSGNLCGPAALVHHPRIEWFSATPDAFVDADGLAEFKVPQVTTYVEWIAGGIIPEQHIAQLTVQLACTGRQWVDFAAYCPEMPPPRRLFVRRFAPTPAEIADCEAAASAFLAEVEAMFVAVTESPA